MRPPTAGGSVAFATCPYKPPQRWQLAPVASVLVACDDGVLTGGGMKIVGGAVVEFVTIDDGDATSYDDDWGGPSLVGVLASRHATLSVRS